MPYLRFPIINYVSKIRYKPKIMQKTPESRVCITLFTPRNMLNRLSKRATTEMTHIIYPQTVKSVLVKTA